MRTCTRCNIKKPVDEYYHLHLFCKACAIKASNARYYKLKNDDPDWIKYRGISDRYKLTKDQHQEMVSKGCSICKTHEGVLIVDHDHSCCPSERCCGKCVRGILCRDCNLMLGRSKDSPDILTTAANYIKDWKHEHESRRCNEGGIKK